MYLLCEVCSKHVDCLGVLERCGAHVVVQRLHLQQADFLWCSDACWQTQSSAKALNATLSMIRHDDVTATVQWAILEMPATDSAEGFRFILTVL